MAIEKYLKAYVLFQDPVPTRTVTLGDGTNRTYVLENADEYRKYVRKKYPSGIDFHTLPTLLDEAETEGLTVTDDMRQTCEKFNRFYKMRYHNNNLDRSSGFSYSQSDVESLDQIMLTLHEALESLIQLEYWYMMGIFRPFYSHAVNPERHSKEYYWLTQNNKALEPKIEIILENCKALHEHRHSS